MAKIKSQKKKGNPVPSIKSVQLPEDTRERLISVAKYLFAEKGFNGSTVKDIADMAGLNISLISYHFQGKEGLYRTCLEQFGNARLAATERLLQKPTSFEEFRIRLQLFLEEVVTAHLEEPELSRIVARECDMQSNLALDIFKGTFLKCHETLINFLKTAQTKGFIRRELDVSIVGGLLLGGILHLAKNDRIGEIFFNRTLKDQSYRENVIKHAISLSLQGCVNIVNIQTSLDRNQEWDKV